jgi:hypothetical protein
MSSVWDLEDYKIRTLVSEAHDDELVYNLNFKTHLKADVALAKTVYMQGDGRPFLKELKHSGITYAVVYTYYIVNAGGLLERKSKYLHYLKDNDELSPPILIFDKTYGVEDTHFVIAEKITSRKNILSKIKSDIMVGLIWANPTVPHPDIVAMGVTFAHDTDLYQRDFADYGYPFFKDFVVAVDTATPGYEWMDTLVAPTVTMKDYIIGALTYTSVSTHPEA